MSIQQNKHMCLWIQKQLVHEYGGPSIKASDHGVYLCIDRLCCDYVPYHDQTVYESSNTLISNEKLFMSVLAFLEHLGQNEIAEKVKKHIG